MTKKTSKIETKICYRCKKIKPITEFHKNKNSKDGFYCYCKECCSELCKEYYKNSKDYREERKKYSKKRKQKINKIIKEIKLKSGCKICGYNKCPDALEFHHINPEVKENKLCRIKSCNKEKILNLISKCQILCANCHRELHWKLNLIGING